MKDVIVLKPNIQEFMDKCSSAVGKKAAEDFDIEMYQQVQDYKITSPIEQLFLFAFNALQFVNGYEGSGEVISNGNRINFGTSIVCQFELNRYRVDFLAQHLSQEMAMDGTKCKNVVVELDGHEFHDKNELQRRYEKKRDRYLQKIGLKVFHYTGAEVVRDPFEPAAEVLGFLTGSEPTQLIYWLKEFMED